MFLFAILGVKNYSFQKIVLIQWFGLQIKTFSAKFRRELDTVLCFECKILKS